MGTTNKPVMGPQWDEVGPEPNRYAQRQPIPAKKKPDPRLISRLKRAR